MTSTELLFAGIATDVVVNAALTFAGNDYGRDAVRELERRGELDRLDAARRDDAEAAA
jgi:hypothetical protein